MTENTVREAFDESEQIIVGIEPCDVLTGGRDKNRFLLYQLNWLVQYVPQRPDLRDRVELSL